MKTPLKTKKSIKKVKPSLFSWKERTHTRRQKKMKVVLVGALLPILLGVVYVMMNQKSESTDESVVVVSEYFKGRDQLVHAIRAPLGVSFPRVSLEDLNDKENKKMDDFRLGRRPFVVSNVSDEWSARNSWNDGADIVKRFPRAVVDYFPYNMLDMEDHSLYLFRFRTAIQDLLSKYMRRDQSKNKFYPGKYLHWQILPDQWREIRGSGQITPFPKWLKQDGWWMNKCLRTKELQDEYHIKTHWRVALIGTAGSGMFNHTDTLRSSSWHVHVSGRKWWYVCHQGTCYEEILDEGDVLYYPRETHHQTQCVPVEPKRTTVTLTGTVVNAHNYRELSDMMHGECVRDRLNFKFSAALCDALDECADLWHKRYSTDGSSSRSVWIPWREVATKKMIHKMETDDWYLGNNYDGRNPISGK